MEPAQRYFRFCAGICSFLTLSVKGKEPAIITETNVV